jgi:hypothetical protein
MANARVPDEEIFYRDPNIRRVESTETYYQPVLKTKLPRWCPEGLTKIQKGGCSVSDRRTCTERKALPMKDPDIGSGG